MGPNVSGASEMSGRCDMKQSMSRVSGLIGLGLNVLIIKQILCGFIEIE